MKITRGKLLRMIASVLLTWPTVIVLTIAERVWFERP